MTPQNRQVVGRNISSLSELFRKHYWGGIAKSTREEHLTRLFANDTNSFISKDTQEQLKTSMKIVLTD